MAVEKRTRERLLKKFNFNETDNLSGSLLVPLQLTVATPLASISLDNININDRVFLRATVGWAAALSLPLSPQIRFAIVRDTPNGVLVYSTVDTANIAITLGQRFTTTMFHTETGLTAGTHSYTLTAQIGVVGVTNQLEVVGPVVLSGAVIDENET